MSLTPDHFPLWLEGALDATEYQLPDQKLWDKIKRRLADTLDVEASHPLYAAETEGAAEAQAPRLASHHEELETLLQAIDAQERARLVQALADANRNLSKFDLYLGMNIEKAIKTTEAIAAQDPLVFVSADDAAGEPAKTAGPSPAVASMHFSEDKVDNVPFKAGQLVKVNHVTGEILNPFSRSYREKAFGSDREPVPSPADFFAQGTAAVRNVLTSSGKTDQDW